jgi:hypothetical protein
MQTVNKSGVKKIIGQFFFVILFCGLLGVITTTQVQAQFGDLSGTVSLIANPQYPGPNETVTVTADSNLFHLERSDIAWYLNGELSKRGVGEESLSFLTGPLGTKTTVAVAVTDPSGKTTTANLTVQPASVDLIWEATDSYVPPFYQGKALRTPQGGVRVIALPTVYDAAGKLIPKENLIYTWSYDDRVLGASSGYGKYIYQTNSILRTPRISVKITTVDNAQTIAYNSVELPESADEIVIYQENPLYGTIFSQALSDRLTLADDEIVLGYYPYFFTVSDPADPKLIWDWKMNGNAFTNTATDPHLLTLRSLGKAGRVSISLDLEHTADLLQGSSADIDIEIPAK